jgi:integrase
VAFRKHPTYVRKARNGYQLQRGVPSDVQPIIGKKVWCEPGGATYREAHARSPGFVARTDRDIAVARGQLVLSPEELIDALLKTHDLKDPEMVALLKEGADVATEEGWLTTEQRQRYLRVLVGEEDPRPQLTAEELFQAARILKGSADRTVAGWRKAMSDFLSFAGVAHPTAATREHAVAYRSHLLQRVKSSTAKTTLAYLAGLWSVLNENHPGHPNVFLGLTRRIKVVKARKVEVHIEDPDIWEGSETHLLILKFLYFTGARLAEIAGLMAEDLLEDRILIRPNQKRSLKTDGSEREIPLHPRLKELASALRKQEGLLWPSQFQPATSRWGVNLSKPAKLITGVSPKGLRDRAATVLRGAGKNEALVVRLLGHTPNWISSEYGAVPWSELVKAVELL